MGLSESLAKIKETFGNESHIFAREGKTNEESVASFIYQIVRFNNISSPLIQEYFRRVR